MLRIDATNLQSPRRAARSRQLAPRAATPRRATLPPPRPEFGSEPQTIPVGRDRLIPPSDDVPPINRTDFTPTRPFNAATAPIPAPALAAAPGPLPPPPYPPRNVLPPELAAQPVTGNTMSPTAIDTAAAAPRTKTRRPFELAFVAVAAFALSWVFRGSLQSASTQSTGDDASSRALSSRSAPAATTLPVCEERSHFSQTRESGTGTSSDIRTVALSDLPLLCRKPSVSATHAPGEHRQPPAHNSNSANGSGAPSRASLIAALSGVADAAAGCGEREGPVKVVLTFGPSGVASSIQVSGKDLPSGTRSCIARAASRARVPAFEGDPVTVAKTL